MATKQRVLSATALQEVRGMVTEAVPRSLGKDITISTPDFKTACSRARASLTRARKAWEDGGRPTTGPLRDGLVAAAVTAEVVCALATA